IVNHTHENKKRKEVHAIFRELQWYNQLVGHVGIHGQRRFTEALENMSRRTLVWVATGREHNATMGCEEPDGAVRSGSTIAMGRFIAIRKRRVCCLYKTSERGLSGRRVRRVCACI
ncbi:hypothetical protein Taro_026154, partial [Colocasia esculenta]|nr:hypothetical protein [Colocasia esculenta]